MPTCTICGRALQETYLADAETGGGVHPACAGERLPADLIVALLALAAAVLVPTVVVWAG